MEMIKVDPKLFITCRLCLEETGMYQITPNVQSQIKYCFDIDVDPFDGMPQLIGANCETILSEYHAKKRIFIGKQNALKARIEVQKDIDGSSVPPQQDAVSSSQQNDGENLGNNRKNAIRRRKRRLRQITSSSSSSDDEVNGRFSTSESKKRNVRKRISTPPAAWESHYNKKYVCRLCNKLISNKANVNSHMRKHVSLLEKFKDIFKMSCTVNLKRLDERPNIIGTDTAVMFCQGKIIRQQGDTNSHILFSSNSVCPEPTPTSYDKSEKSEEASDNELNVTKRKLKKRRRLLSTETVVLNESVSKSRTADQQESIQMECINIDDSSNSSSTKSLYSSTKDDERVLNKADDSDERELQKLIMNCYNKYMRKYLQNFGSCPKNMNPSNQSAKIKSSIIHKIMSMGLKVINNPGIQCTGLLRFMEHSNLDVKWIPSYTFIGPKESNYVRIKISGKDKSTSDNLGWKDINTEYSEISDCETYLPEDAVMTSSKKSNNDKIGSTDVTSISDDTSRENPLFSIGQSQSNLNLGLQESDKKLLNANPVANPRQLPKKFCATDTNTHVQVATEEIALRKTMQNVTNNKSVCVVNDGHSECETYSLPIITSTKSLTVVASSDTQITSTINNEISSTGSANITEKPVPRIKVKPASELMSERVLKSLNEQQAARSESVIVAQANENTVQSEATSEVIIDLVAVSSSNTVASPQQINRECVIMDTVEFPNTKTDSPIKYFTNLLKAHNIFLLDSQTAVPSMLALNLLLKFRVQFLRESETQPLELCLSVYYAGNTFLVTVKDSDNVNIDLNTLPAIWQLEILKLNLEREDVNKRMLKNAQLIGPAAYNYTKTFLCLLKSIKFKNSSKK